MRKQRKSNYIPLYCIALILVTAALVVALINHEKLQVKNFDSDNKEISTSAELAEKETTTQIETTTVDNTRYEVSLVAVGDDLIHDSVIKYAQNSDGSYDFTSLFENVKDQVEAADLAVINQETILGGADLGYSGYPCFNSPDEVGQAAIAAGFDLFLQATNHAMDMGTAGIEHDINFYKDYPEVTMIGLNENKKSYNNIKIIEKNNIKIAVLNYTYGLNGFSLPEGKEYLVNMLDEKKIKKDLAAAEKKADFTIVFPHWGIEYQHTPTDEQVSLAKMMVENGADLIIGTHPHVVEGIEWIESSNGNKGLCYYSLGNFTSHQDMTATMLGGMAKLTIVKQAGKVYIEDGAGVIPLVTHYKWGEGGYTTTYYLKDYTEEQAAAHSIHYYGVDFTVEELNRIADEVLGDWIIE